MNALTNDNAPNNEPNNAQPFGAGQEQRVHHSYIWLSSLSSFVVIAVVMFFSAGGSMIGLVAEGGFDVEGGFAMAIGAVVLIGFLLLLLGIIVLVQWLSYKHLWYVLGPEDFSLYSGIISKKRVHVPYQRIQSVDQKATLIQRIFGVCNVTIDTAGGSSNKAVLVPYLTKERAETLRHELYARKAHALNGMAPGQQSMVQPSPQLAGMPQPAAQAFPQPGQQPYPQPASSPMGPQAAPQPGTQPAAPPPGGNVLDGVADVWNVTQGAFGGVPVELQPPSFQYGLTNKELVFTGLTGNTAFNLIVLAILGGILQLADVLGFLMPGAEDYVENLIYDFAVGNVASDIAMGIVGIVLVIAVAIWLLSIVGSCISYGGFKATRRGNRIEIERGLLQHVIQGVNVDRVQSVVVKQSFIRRLMGYCELSLGRIDAATEGQDPSTQSLAESGLVIHPFVKTARVPEILQGLVPEFANGPEDDVKLAPVALRRGVIRRAIVQGAGFWTAVATLAIAALCHWLVESDVMETDPDLEGIWIFVAPFFDFGVLALLLLATALFVYEVISAVKWSRGSSYAVNRHFMKIHNGGLTTETVTVPRAKIQHGATRANPLQRRAKTVTMKVRSAAGVGGTTVSLIDVSQDNADAWLSWVEPGGGSRPGHA